MWRFLGFWHAEHHAAWQVHATVLLALLIVSTWFARRLQRMWPMTMSLAWMLAHALLGAICAFWWRSPHLTSEHFEFWLVMIAATMLQTTAIQHASWRTSKREA